MHRVAQLLKRFKDIEDRLVVVDLERGLADQVEVEGTPVHIGRCERELALADRRNQPGAVQLDPVVLADQPELDGDTLVTPRSLKPTPMTTTSLKLPDALKQRAAQAAQRQGISPHAFMVQAIEQAATLAEQRAGFVAEALGAREQMLTTGEGYDAADVHDWLKARVTDRKAARPQAKPWRG